MARRPDAPRSPVGLRIRPATGEDHDIIWKIFQETIATGDTFVYDANTTREKAVAHWCGDDAVTFVAEKNGKVIGSYLLRPNQAGLGAHVANAGYMVEQSARGLGVGRAMGQHSLEEARRRGYRAMQFNFVVSTNESAAHLWRELGFNIVGTLPGAFRHAQKGFVDVYVMFRSLED